MKLSSDFAMIILSHIYDEGQAGKCLTLTPYELEAINQGIGALKTLEDIKLNSASVYGKIVSCETLEKEKEQ